MIDRRQLAEAIAERTMHIKNIAQLKREVAAYLLAEHRTHDIDSLIRDIVAYRAEHGLIEATAISAYPLTAQVRKEVMQELKVEYPHAKSIVINEKIDPGVIGGVRIEAVNEQLDLTVRSKLNTLKRLTAARN